MILYSIIIFLILTFLFFLVIAHKTNLSRCSNPKEKCYDGNGIYQYKGRGDKEESIDILLSRIDWLAKNSTNNMLYSTSYIISYAFTLAIIIILYAFSLYICSPWEIIVIIFAAFIISFSILNLFQFHTDSYPNYYIRKNIDYISRQMRCEITDPPLPSFKSKVPFRTKVYDVLIK